VAALMACQMLESVEGSLTCWTDMDAFAVVLGDSFGGLVAGWRMLGHFDHSVDLGLWFGGESDGHLMYRRIRCRQGAMIREWLRGKWLRG
jgi:hypothetical protein